MSALDNQQIPAFNLCHYAGECRVDEGIEGRVTNEVMGDVYLETFVG
jgi:hypothetical protein